MKVEFRSSFTRDLKKVSENKVRQRVRQAIEQVETADQLAEIAQLKKLSGEGSYYRIRIGDYRIGLKVEQETVIFVHSLACLDGTFTGAFRRLTSPHLPRYISFSR